jgi:hypothetical protein
MDIRFSYELKKKVQEKIDAKNKPAISFKSLGIIRIIRIKVSKSGRRKGKRELVSLWSNWYLLEILLLFCVLKKGMIQTNIFLLLL